MIVDGRPVDDAVFGAAWSACASEVAGLPEDLGETTQFEVLTVAALLAFAESGVEAVALEAGLGGRLDATNVVRAPVVVLTNIALEHTEVLGDTRELIFAEKAAVIKGGDAVFGPLDGLEEEARRVCSAAGARPHFLRDVRGTAATSRVSGAPDDFAVSARRGRRGGALGRSARAHAGPVPGAERRAGRGRRAPAPRRPRRGRRAAGAGRHRRPRPPAGGRRAARSCSPTAPTTRTACACSRRAWRPSQVPRPTVGVLAIMRDKDYPAMLAGFLPLLDRVVCTQASEPRSLDGRRSWRRPSRAGGRGGRLAGGAAVEAVDDPHAALARARELAGPDGSVLVGGSLYLLEDLGDVLAGPG